MACTLPVQYTLTFLGTDSMFSVAASRVIVLQARKEEAAAEAGVQLDV